MFRKHAAQQAFDDASDAVASTISAAPLESAVDAMGELAGDVGELAVDVVDAAAATTRVGLRLATRTIRFVARHPKGVLAGLMILVALGAAAGYFGKSDQSSSTS